MNKEITREINTRIQVISKINLEIKQKSIKCRDDQKRRQQYKWNKGAKNKHTMQEGKTEN